ncbi:hypothetical protein GGR51DRAFT_256989 [Nemania sp. FL0031]|nr:hypothetical protein GGR51DRAFT_256989 [Nemania sp. FL0031]
MAEFGDRARISEIVDHLETAFYQVPWPRQSSSSLPPWCIPTPPYNPPPPGIPADTYHSRVPAGPPPGLVRALPPSLAPTHLITNNEASLFSDFACYLDRGVDENGYPVIVDLTCAICLDRKLVVPSCVTSPNQTFESDNFEWLTVLPCGHFFGSKCLESWIEEAQWDHNAVVPCPLCRFKLAYACGHPLLPREYNPLWTRNAQMPMTFPEGGDIPRVCEECFELELDERIEGVQAMIFPLEVPHGDFRRPDLGNLIRETSAKFRQAVWNFTSVRRHFNYW